MWPKKQISKKVEHVAENFNLKSNRQKSVENMAFQSILENRFYFSPKYLKEKAVLIKNK